MPSRSKFALLLVLRRDREGAHVDKERQRIGDDDVGGEDLEVVPVDERPNLEVRPESPGASDTCREDHHGGEEGWGSIRQCMPFAREMELVQFIRYANFPPVRSSVPSTSYAGSSAHNARLSAYQPNVPSAPSTLIKPVQPGHPTCCFKISLPCHQPLMRESVFAVKVWRRVSSAGAGQPVTSLQAKAKT